MASGPNVFIHMPLNLLCNLSYVETAPTIEAVVRNLGYILEWQPCHDSIARLLYPIVCCLILMNLQRHNFLSKVHASLLRVVMNCSILYLKVRF